MAKKLKVGVIGLGMWGQNHPLVYDDYERSEIAVVCDLNEDKAKNIARIYRCDWTSKIEELVSSDISTFSVATPDHSHLDPVSKLLKANKNVLVEKPLATSLIEAKILTELAEASTGISMVNFHLRWDPQWALIKDTISEGGIGKPHFKLQPFPARPSQLQYRSVRCDDNRDCCNFKCINNSLYETLHEKTKF